MAIWPFNRRKKAKSDLPKEVQDYYEAEKRERVGVAGLLAVATLLVTVLLAIGLFFGTRWVYRTVFDNDDSGNVAQQDQNAGQNGQADQPAESENPAEPEAPAPTPEPAPTPTPAPAPAPAPSTPAPTPATPSTEGSSSRNLATTGLPNTGPADTAAIVLAVTTISGLAFYVVRRSQEQEN